MEGAQAEARMSHSKPCAVTSDSLAERVFDFIYLRSSRSSEAVKCLIF